MTGRPHETQLSDLLCRAGAQSEFHARARAAACRKFGREVFVRGVVEISNFCRENCHYCGMRRDNRSLDRYRAALDVLGEALLHRRPSVVTDINLQAGEDPVAVREVALPLIRLLRRHTKLGVSVCLGTLDPAAYEALHEAGASGYILKFETAHPDGYELREGPGTLRERVGNIRWLAAHGWYVSSGFIAGLPDETPEDSLESCRLAETLPLTGCSVSPFIPGESTPLATAPRADLDLVLNCMAALRLRRPDWIIPAVSALNIGQPGEGYRRGLAAGANLATINLTPPALREDYLLYRRERFIMDEENLLASLEAVGLRPSPTSLIRHLQREQTLRQSALQPA